MSTQPYQEQGNTGSSTLVLLHGRADAARIWDPVATLLEDRLRIVRCQAGAAGGFGAVVEAVAMDGPVHVLVHGREAADVWDFVTRPDASRRIASVTWSDPGRPRGLRGRSRRGAPNLATAVEVPVQLIVSAGAGAGYDALAAQLPRLWRRDVSTGRPSPTTHPELFARSVRQLVDHLDGAPAARELLRAQVGRARKPFGDTLVSITGASSGIGRETALAFAREGADVVLSDIDAAGLDETARLVTALGAAVHSYPLDVADAAAVDAFADEVCARHGVPDVVVNNAGVGHAGFFLDTPAEEFDRVLAINFGGVVNGCRAFGKRLVERGVGGHIVNVASMASYTPVNVMNAYCTSKAAVFMFSDCFRAELDSAGIGLTTICPGVVGTNIVEATRFSLPATRDEDAETMRGRVRKGFAARRYGPEKVAEAIVSAVRKKQAVRPVTPEARLVYAVARALPPAMRSAARGGNIL